MNDLSTPSIGVIIADDHEVVRHGLRLLLSGKADIRLLGEAHNGREAIRLVAAMSPQVALIDLQMPEGDGVEVTSVITKDYPATAVVILTSFSDDSRLYAALRAGAMGYLLKDIAGDTLVQAIRGAARGEPQLHPAIARRLMQQAAPPSDPLGELTERETAVLRLIGQGLSNKEIAAMLGLATETIKRHVSDILAKLQVADRTQAALVAVRYGLIRFDDSSFM